MPTDEEVEVALEEVDFAGMRATRKLTMREVVRLALTAAEQVRALNAEQREEK